jgi:hypothetical protein
MGTIFFPGRSFETLEDLNQQALDWSTHRMANRPVGKTRLIPANAFEYEKPFLIKLPSALPAPYLLHGRGIDQYGYVALEANYYWVPGTSRHEVSVLQYSDQLKIYHERQLLGEYELPPEGIKNEVFYPKGHRKPVQQPKWRKKPAVDEEKKLRATGKQVDAYVAFVKKQKGIQVHRFIRALYGLSQKLASELFIQTINRAHKYRISDIKTIERIAILMMKDTKQVLPSVVVDENLQNRDSYRQGCLTDHYSTAPAGFSSWVKPMGGELRRAILQFDIARTIPKGSTINSVMLQLNATRAANKPAPEKVELHKLLASWAEGTSSSKKGEGTDRWRTRMGLYTLS